MRRTIIAPNAWAASGLRFSEARAGNVGCRVLAIEHAVARLAGGFKRPIDRVVVLDALKEVLQKDSPAAFQPALGYPGLVRALTSTLLKVWSADLDLGTMAAKNPQIAALHSLEQAVLARLPAGMLRHGDLKKAAFSSIGLAPTILGPIAIVGRTEMSPVWRDFITALAKVVPITWEAGARQVPPWIDPAISVVRGEPKSAPRRYLSCADAAHEVMEALRWARGVLVSGKVKAEEIAICAAAPQAYDGAMSAASANTVLPVHFIHGRLASESRDGQEAAALADIFLNGLSLQGIRRLGSLAQGPAFRALPEGWMAVLPREAPLANLARWRDYLASIDNWPGGIPFGEQLLAIVAALEGSEETATALGQQMLGGKARAIWERGLLEGPPAALSSSIAGLSVTDPSNGLSAIAWGSAAAIASLPRPYVWILGLNAGSWPRGIAEDPLLPAHLCDQALLDPLPLVDADRRDFETLLRVTTAEIVISRSRRDVEGRELGISPLWPIDAKVEELVKSAAPSCPISEGDRLSGRVFEYKASPQGGAAGRTWRDWHRPEVTKHDGLIRADHPLILAALQRPMSASSIKLMLTDPISWLFKEVMGLTLPELEGEPFELLANAYGNLVHGVLERVTGYLAAENGKSSVAEVDVALMAAALERAIQETAKIFEIEVPVPPMRLWRSTLERARVMSETALNPGFLAPLAGQRSWAEIPFGRKDEPPLEGAPWDTTKPIVLAGVEITGKVDRLDLSADGKTGRVIDWKTGKVPKEIEEWTINGGAEVQRPIYAGVAFQLTGASEVEAGLAYLKGGEIFVPIAEAKKALDMLEVHLRAMRSAVQAGLTLPGSVAGSLYNPMRFALPGDAKERYLEEKALAIREALGPAAHVWDEP